MSQPIVVTSQTDRYLWKTTFSHYLGQMNYRNAKKIIFFDFNIILASVKVLVLTLLCQMELTRKLEFFPIFHYETILFSSESEFSMKMCSFEVHHDDIAQKLGKLKGGS